MSKNINLDKKYALCTYSRIHDRRERGDLKSNITIESKTSFVDEVLLHRSDQEVHVFGGHAVVLETLVFMNLVGNFISPFV